MLEEKADKRIKVLYLFLSVVLGTSQLENNLNSTMIINRITIIHELRTRLENKLMPYLFNRKNTEIP